MREHEKLCGDGDGDKTCGTGWRWRQGLRRWVVDGDDVMVTGFGWGRTDVPVQLSIYDSTCCNDFLKSLTVVRLYVHRYSCILVNLAICALRGIHNTYNTYISLYIFITATHNRVRKRRPSDVAVDARRNINRPAMTDGRPSPTSWFACLPGLTDHLSQVRHGSRWATTLPPTRSGRPTAWPPVPGPGPGPLTDRPTVQCTGTSR